MMIATIPHSGERVPDICPWLIGLPENILMYDVDRYVDRLYESSLTKLGIKYVKTDWHRYAADLNRVPEDIDAGTVVGATHKPGSFDRGFHWRMTTAEYILMKNPMTHLVHQKLTETIYDPFHQSVRDLTAKKSSNECIYHLDLHSMPSLGTRQHRDPGEKRADIVISDCKGQSSKPEFVNWAILAFVKAGFKVAYNWPYFGGRVSEQYGKPNENHHTIQIELNRALYMDEKSKQWLPPEAEALMPRLEKALSSLFGQLSL